MADMPFGSASGASGKKQAYLELSRGCQRAHYPQSAHRALSPDTVIRLRVWKSPLNIRLVEHLLSPPLRVERLPLGKPRKQHLTNYLLGTLDMLILRTLLCGPAHGPTDWQTHSAADKRVSYRCSTDELSPRLHRLRKAGLGEWLGIGRRLRTTIGKGQKYPLTEEGRERLRGVEESQWKQIAKAVTRVMWPTVREES